MFATLRRSVGGLIVSPTKSTPAEASTQQTPSRAAPSLSSINTSSAPDVYVYLVLENSHGDVKAEYPIRKQSIKIGRLSTNDIRIYMDNVSRIHCEVRCSTEGQATLHVLNMSGVRINGKLAKKLIEASGDGKGQQPAFTLHDGDLISIHRNAFRVRYPAKTGDRSSDSRTKGLAEDSENIAPAPLSPRKALRMSLVRAAVVDTPSKRNSSDDEPKASTSQSPERAPLGTLRVAPQPASASNDSAPKRRRQSLVFATPTRPVQPLTTPWTAEPSKRSAARQAVSKSLPDASNWSDAVEVDEKEHDAQVDKEEAVVVIEEMDSEDHAEGDPEERESALTPAPPSPTKQHDRLTQSSSPKKPRRRSSFFGRAGVFANWNFGFYPDERKAARESEEEAGNCSLGDEELDGSPSGLPEPRLDENGRPRLPRSLSSPGGLGYASPPKRRVVSLRTATLLRQGQNAFEQRKLRSPSSSPRKDGGSSLRESTISIMSVIEERKSAAEESDRDAAADAAAAYDKAILSNSRSLEDDDDADEVDRSLSMMEEEQQVEPARVQAGKASKGRKSDPTTVSEPLPKRTDRARASMPAKLVSIAFVEGSGACADLDVEQLKSQWLLEQARGGEVQSNGDGNVSAHESDTDSEFGGDAEEAELGEEKATIPPLSPSHSVSGGGKYGMLRHLVRDNADLTALVEAQAKEDELREEARSVATASPARAVVALDVMAATSEEEPAASEEQETDAGWQVVSPRRAKWKAKDTVATRRASECAHTKLTQERESEVLRVSKRRITAAPTLGSGPLAVRTEQPIAAEVVAEVLAAAKPVMLATSRSSAKRSSSPQENVRTAARDTAGVQVSPCEVEIVHGVSPSKRPRRRDAVEPPATTDSPTKRTSPAKKSQCDSPEKKSLTVSVAPATPSSTKKVRAKRSVQSLRKPLQPSTDNQLEVEDEEEAVHIVSVQSSSPTAAKTTRRKAASSSTAPKRATAVVTSAAATSSPSAKPSRRRAPASESAPTIVATTRSGRAVRKPVDLKQPATVVQSDPVQRVTRSRARKG